MEWEEVVRNLIANNFLPQPIPRKQYQRDTENWHPWIILISDWLAGVETFVIG